MIRYDIPSGAVEARPVLASVSTGLEVLEPQLDCVTFLTRDKWLDVAKHLVHGILKICLPDFASASLSVASARSVCSGTG